MLKEEEHGTQPLDTNLSQKIIDKCEKAAVKNQLKLDLKKNCEPLQEKRAEGLLDIFNVISSPRVDIAEKELGITANEILNDEGDALRGSSSSGTSPNPDELEENELNSNDDLNGAGLVNGH